MFRSEKNYNNEKRGEEGDNVKIWKMIREK